MKSLLSRFTIVGMLTILCITIGCNHNEPSNTNTATRSETVDSTTARLNNLFEQLYKNDQFNGTVLVAEKGKPIFKTAMGYADTLRNPLQLNSQFALGHINIQFTTMAIMMLKEAGKLDFSDNVKKYIPKLPYEGVTIYHLLTYTDGLPNYWSLAYKYWDAEKRKTATNKDVIELLVNHPSKDFNPPGDTLDWTGSGSVLMAYIIAEVSGESYADFLEKHIFNPLGMSNTLVYNQLKDSSKIKNRAHQFKQTLNGKDLVGDEIQVRSITGQGGIYSTVEDLLKWDRALYTDKLVSQATLQQAFTPTKLNDGKYAVWPHNTYWPGIRGLKNYHYGFGWDMDSISGSHVVYHGGGSLGNMFYRNIDKDRTVILLTNNSTMYGHNNHFIVFDCIAGILNNQPIDIPKPSIAEKIAPVLAEKGGTEAMALYKSLKENESSNYDFKNPAELFSLAIEISEKGRVDDALILLKTNTKEFPDFSSDYFYLCQIYWQKGDYASAKSAVEKFIELEPSYELGKQILQAIEAKMENATEDGTK